MNGKYYSRTKPINTLEYLVSLCGFLLKKNSLFLFYMNSLQNKVYVSSFVRIFDSLGKSGQGQIGPWPSEKAEKTTLKI